MRRVFIYNLTPSVWMMKFNKAQLKKDEFLARNALRVTEVPTLNQLQTKKLRKKVFRKYK